MVHKCLLLIQEKKGIGGIIHCLICLKKSEKKYAICSCCQAKLPWLPHACYQCGELIASSQQRCQFCQAQPSSLERVQALFAYQAPFPYFIDQLKRQGRLFFAPLLGTWLADHLEPTWEPDWVIPLPLSALKQKTRGFNQNQEIANVLAKKRGWVLCPWHCTRSSLSLPLFKGREKNLLLNPFRLHPRGDGKHVLVISDVIRTGATVRALAQALKAQGVATVEIWACCKEVV